MSAGVLKDAGDPLGVLLLGGQVRHRDVRPLAGEGDRGGGADPRVGSRDERLAALESPRAAVAVLPVVRPRFEFRVEAGLGLMLPIGVEVGVQLSGVGHGVLIASHAITLWRCRAPADGGCISRSTALAESDGPLL